MMKMKVFIVFGLWLMTVVCEDQHLGENQMHHFQDSLFNIFERLGDTLNRNQTITEDKSGNVYILNIVKNVSLTMPSSSHSNSELLNRITKLETMETTLLQNQKSLEDQIRDLKSGNFVQEEINSCNFSTSSGVFQLQIPNLSVYCEMETFDGGWLVIQQRTDLTLSFDRSWAEYRAGFGTVGKKSSFWLGLEHIHQLTTSGNYELAVELKNTEGKYGYARYSDFKVAGESDKYRLTVGGYVGNVDDKLKHHNNSKFTTYDSDNESWDKGNCATYWSSGWWYNDCYAHSALNYKGGPFWANFASYGTYSRMMIRRKP